MSDAIKHIVIAGGGTAGWLTAGILAADHCANSPEGVKITLIESPHIPTLGVGEGTWPSMRDTLRRIGISETDFIRRCNASFKQGSRFDGWVDGSPDDSYFHPFDALPNQDEIDFQAVWQQAPNGMPFGAAMSAQVPICLERRAPKQATTPEYAAVTNYAYHLDAGAFAEMLREHCTAHLGVELISDTIKQVVQNEQGDIASLTLENTDPVQADLYIDCTGSRALLIGQTLNSPLTDVSDILFNDQALALHVPYKDDQGVVESQTNGTALSEGWVWDIALQTRRGVGHVFSSRFADEDIARGELAKYLKKAAPDTDVTADDARLINFTSAYRKDPWVKNVVAIGMSQGFVEPLEASAIVMVELSASMVRDTLPPHKSMLAVTAQRYNDRFAYRWSRIVDFLKLHYILSKRPEPYWGAHRDQETWTPRLREMMTRWAYEPPSREDFTQTQEIFPASSYSYVLYGMGFKTNPSPTRRRQANPALAQRYLQETSERTQKFISGLPSNRDLINHVLGAGLPKV